MPPALVRLTAEGDVHEWPPFRPARLANEVHARLVGKAVALARIARDAGADHVFPGRQAALIAREDVIEVELVSLERFPAILAGVRVALEDIVPGKFHFLLRQAVEKEKHDDARHPDFP